MGTVFIIPEILAPFTFSMDICKVCLPFWVGLGGVPIALFLFGTLFITAHTDIWHNTPHLLLNRLYGTATLFSC
jgi:hypothetical protein